VDGNSDCDILEPLDLGLFGDFLYLAGDDLITLTIISSFYGDLSLASDLGGSLSTGFFYLFACHY
jgi:hypothetical protein